MDETMQLSDFDFQIGEILLVHKNSHVPDFKWTQYRTGRKMDGLVFCVGGRALYDFGGERLELAAGQVLFLPESSNYTLRCISGDPFLHYTVNFRLRDVQVPASSAAAEIFAGRRRHVTDPDGASIFAAHFERILSVWQGKGGGYPVLAKAILYELLYLYFTDAGHARRCGSDYGKLLPAIRMLDECNTGEYTVAELARLCGLSETHFRRLFSALMGTSPTDYRTRKRILRARDLLASGQYSVAETARKAGFSDPSYFSRVFRAHTGVSPGEFKNG